MATSEPKEMANHEGLAPYMDGRMHQFLAHAQGWHRHESKDDIDYYNLLVHNVRIRGRAEIIDDHCWINDKALGRVLDTKDKNQREWIVGRDIAFDAEVGIYYPKQESNFYFGYCFRKVTHLHTVEKEPAAPGGWRIQFLDDNSVVVAHDTASLSVSKCPSSGKLIARPCREILS